MIRIGINPRWTTQVLIVPIRAVNRLNRMLRLHFCKAQTEALISAVTPLDSNWKNVVSEFRSLRLRGPSFSQLVRLVSYSCNRNPASVSSPSSHSSLPVWLSRTYFDYFETRKVVPLICIVTFRTEASIRDARMDLDRGDLRVAEP